MFFLSRLFQARKALEPARRGARAGLRHVRAPEGEHFLLRTGCIIVFSHGYFKREEVLETGEGWQLSLRSIYLCLQILLASLRSELVRRVSYINSIKRIGPLVEFGLMRVF